jgi:hypothetical protein
LLRRPLIALLYKPLMIDDDECGTVGGMRNCRGNRSTKGKPAPMPLCPPQITQDLNWTRTHAAAVGSRRRIFFLIDILGGGVQLGALGTAANSTPIVAAPGDYDDGEIGGMMIGRGNRSTRKIKERTSIVVVVKG